MINSDCQTYGFVTTLFNMKINRKDGNYTKQLEERSGMAQAWCGEQHDDLFFMYRNIDSYEDKIYEDKSHKINFWLEAQT